MCLRVRKKLKKFTLPHVYSRCRLLLIVEKKIYTGPAVGQSKVNAIIAKIDLPYGTLRLFQSVTLRSVKKCTDRDRTKAISLHNKEVRFLLT